MNTIFDSDFTTLFQKSTCMNYMVPFHFSLAGLPVPSFIMGFAFFLVLFSDNAF